MNTTTRYQVTEQGNKEISVYIQDKSTGMIISVKAIKRAQLAKLMFLNQIVGSKHGKFVWEI